MRLLRTAFGPHECGRYELLLDRMNAATTNWFWRVVAAAEGRVRKGPAIVFRMHLRLFAAEASLVRFFLQVFRRAASLGVDIQSGRINGLGALVFFNLVGLPAA